MISLKFLLEVSKRPTYAAMWHRRSISRYLLLHLDVNFVLAANRLPPKISVGKGDNIDVEDCPRTTVI